jgi:hypothetical protein
MSAPFGKTTPATTKSRVTAAILDCFAEPEDPCVERSKRHQLVDIIVLSICGVVCGADGWVGIEVPGLLKRLTQNT